MSATSASAMNLLGMKPSVRRPSPCRVTPSPKEEVARDIFFVLSELKRVAIVSRGKRSLRAHRRSRGLGNESEDESGASLPMQRRHAAWPGAPTECKVTGREFHQRTISESSYSFISFGNKS